jgi:parallel beta-helix repeat protein
MENKTLKTSCLLSIICISIIFPIVVISFASAKKPEYISGPVYINDAVPGHSWEDWSVQPWLKGSGVEEDPYIIKDLTIDVDNTVFGLMINGSSSHFKIMKCNFRNAGIPGQRTAALVLLGTTNGVIFKSTFFGSNAGIALIGSGYNYIHKNLCYGNEAGIFLEWCMHNTIKQNDCKDNYGAGIMVSSSHKNIIEKNYCTGNDQAGIYFVNLYEPEHSPKDNIIYANKIEKNYLGIYLSDADLNDFLRNTVSQNEYGMLLEPGSEQNTVYHNNFIDNSIQMIDYNPSMNNWNHPFMREGNFWSDYGGVDENEDGIGDTSYFCDEHPLMEKGGWDFYTSIEEEVLNAFFNNTNRLGADRVVDGTQTSYIIYGVIQLFSERVEGEASPPYTMSINETLVEDSVWYFDEDGYFYGEPGLLQFYYLILPPYYLYDIMDPGYGEYFVKLTWYMSGELDGTSFYTGFYLI